MASVEVRHVSRRYNRGDKEGMIVAGAMQMSGGQVANFPAGSFQLRHVDVLQLTPQPGTNLLKSVTQIYGSVRNPNGAYNNTVLLEARSVGTPVAATNRAGGTLGGGTVTRAYFTAYGY